MQEAATYNSFLINKAWKMSYEINSLLFVLWQYKLALDRHTGRLTHARSAFRQVYSLFIITRLKLLDRQLISCKGSYLVEGQVRFKDFTINERQLDAGKPGSDLGFVVKISWFYVGAVINISKLIILLKYSDWCSP